MAKLLYETLTFKIRRAIFNVYNCLGYGHKETVYQKALEKELSEINLPYQKEPLLKVEYKGEQVGSYKPDFVVDNKIVIEIKAVEFMPKAFETQLLHYLKTTKYNLGLLVNFGSPRLTIRRLVWTNNQCKSVINP